MKWLTTDTSIERDSTKDEAVVFIFIIATVGLLSWAALKPWVGRWIDVRIPFPSSYSSFLLAIHLRYLVAISILIEYWFIF